MDATIDEVIAEAVNAIREAKHTEQHEIEARLGRMQDGHFISGVNQEWFNVLLQRLELCSTWSHQDAWQDSEDTTFESRGRQVRQSRVCNTKECRIEVRTIHKSRKACVCVPLGSSRGDEGQDPFHLVPTGVNMMRISYSIEAPVSRQSFPEIVYPIYVRLKQRRSFVLESSALQGASWRFDLTRTWSGKTRAEAEESQCASPPICEVELEWIPPICATKLPVDMARSLSASFYAKMSALI